MNRRYTCSFLMLFLSLNLASAAQPAKKGVPEANRIPSEARDGGDGATSLYCGKVTKVWFSLETERNSKTHLYFIIRDYDKTDAAHELVVSDLEAAKFFTPIVHTSFGNQTTLCIRVNNTAYETPIGFVEWKEIAPKAKK